MFDELQDKNQQNSTINSPIPSAPQKPSLEDIFSETEQKEKPAVFQKKPEIDFEDTPRSDIQDHGHQKVFFLIFLILILLLLGGGSFWGYRYFINKFADKSTKETTPEVKTEAVNDKQNNIPAENNETQKTLENNEIKTEENAPEEPKIDNTQATKTEEIVESALDSDNDGLTDEEEWRLGTAVDNVDTDIDGLFDREEVKVYKTNPKIADSDGDGYSDGDEVRGGYNPLGSGKLFDVNK